MSEQRVVDEVRFSIEVAVPLDHAFRVFTEQFDSIKPREHNILGVAIAETVLEAKPDGQVYDRGIDGSTCVWGRVLEVDPPHRLVFAWLISPQWQIEQDEGRA
ncbi:MAG TPA: ATPase, partial [Actinomycetota bacterium]|nr:ATPase [Actinomycetota bacterium]